VGRRVIVADDSKTVQKVIRIILAPAGYEVECFDNGSDALMAIKNSPPSLVFADVGMQHMDGYELGILVKNEPRLKNIPVILMYGANYEINYEKFISSGARDKILKPFDAKTLNELVRKHALKAVDSSNMGVINIDTAAVSSAPRSTLPQDWDMDSFAEPGVPDVKAPLKDVEDPEVLKKEFKDLELQNVDIDDGSELSEDESHHLYKEYDLEEKNDGTIQFKAEGSSPLELVDDRKETAQPENDMGLWDDKFYAEVSKEDDLVPELKIEVEDQELLVKDTPKKVPKEIPAEMPKAATPDLYNEADLNRKLIEISEPLIKKMLQNLLPDVTEKMVREELNKLLAGD
jgi:CheY-like chemotaxis protein